MYHIGIIIFPIGYSLLAIPYWQLARHPFAVTDPDDKVLPTYTHTGCEGRALVPALALCHLCRQAQIGNRQHNIADNNKNNNPSSN